MAEALTERQAFLVLNSLPGMGPITLNRLLDACDGDPCLVLGRDRRLLSSVQGVNPKAVEALCSWETHFNLAREEDRLAKAGATFVIVKDKDYPPMLREIHDPPIGLYRLGSYDFQDPCVAIVGSRKTTLYGQSVAKRFGEELARAGFCVVSGLARGIDTSAHQGALAAGGRTAAVLGVGIDIVYPPENLDLYRSIAASGAVLSEFPFGRRADRQSFAMRNRIVSGICKAVIVVESEVDGGSMITARFAGEQGRMLCAVPGRIDQPGSGGCHQLIRDGATLVTCVDDVLEEMNYLRRSDPDKGSAEVAEKPKLPPEEQAVMDCFAGGERTTVDEIAERLGESASAVGAILMMLEIKRLVAKQPDGCYEAR
jgi:DNA processing protein